MVQICLLAVFVFILVGCAADSDNQIYLPDYSDPIGSYDTESVLTPEGNKSEELSEDVQGETTEDGFAVKFKKYPPLPQYTAHPILPKFQKNLPASYQLLLP